QLGVAAGACFAVPSSVAMGPPPRVCCAATARGYPALRLVGAFYLQEQRGESWPKSGRAGAEDGRAPIERLDRGPRLALSGTHALRRSPPAAAADTLRLLGRRYAAGSCAENVRGTRWRRRVRQLSNASGS